jgi:hypothetical protein
MANQSKSQLLCPSSRCGEGSLLLGIIGSDGKAGYINPAPMVDKKFVENAGCAPEQRFRFAAPCRESACAHWTGTRCGVIDHATSVAESTDIGTDSPNPLPRCAVRSRCRWFAQHGQKACFVCPSVFNYVWPEG